MVDEACIVEAPRLRHGSSSLPPGSPLSPGIGPSRNPFYSPPESPTVESNSSSMDTAKTTQSSVSEDGARAPSSATSATQPDSALKEDCGCGSDEKALVTDEIPSQSVIKKANELELLDSNGEKQTFQSIYATPDVDRHLVIFVRHFFCGLCQEYIRHLSTLLPPRLLPPRTAISFVSCGSHELIPSYVQTTGCPYPLYTDPTRTLFSTFSLARTLKFGSKKPAYAKQSFFGMVATSALQALSSGRNILHGGDSSQVGGEFLFVRDKSSGEWRVDWCHRMTTTRDHTEVLELRRLLNLDDNEKEGQTEYRARGWKSGFVEIQRWRSGKRSKSVNLTPQQRSRSGSANSKGKERMVEVGA